MAERALKRRGRLIGSIAATLAMIASLMVAGLSSPAAAAPGHSVELRVLVVAVGSSAADPARAYIEGTMDAIGVPYTVLDASTTDLTEAMLRTDGVGHFNGIILTDAELRNSSAADTFTEAEWSILHEYERDFNVRESVLTGFPATTPGRTDYGMGTVATESFWRAEWTGAAADLYPEVNRALALDIDIFGYAGQSRNDPSIVVTPLLVDQSNPTRGLVSLVEYADGREVLLASINQLDVLRHSQILSYGFVDFATRGLHLGARRVHLSVHLDDLFLASSLWDSEANETSSTESYRTVPADIVQAVAQQAAFNAAHPTASGFELELAFNGVGASLSDPLTQAVITNEAAFGFINHTYTHRNLDTENGAVHADIVSEINTNLTVWQQLGLNGRSAGASALVTGEHSGLADGDTAYPTGLNPGLTSALAATGVDYIASDVSRTNQNREQYLVGSSTIMLPRYPTSVYYNVTTPDMLADEYDYINRERHIENGDDPCEIPGAVCTERSYQEILDAEAAVTVTHMLSGRPWPHYMHTANLADYDPDGDGATLVFDWLDAVLSLYEQHVDLPVVNLSFPEIGAQTAARLAVADASVSAVLTIGTGAVTISADRVLPMEVTGLTGGSAYGAKLISGITASGAPQVFAAADYTPPSGYPLPPTPTPTATPTPTSTPGPTPTPTPGEPVLCAGRVATIIGTNGPDQLTGTGGPDVIVGLDGDDTIDGGGGRDVICGGPGHDVIDGGSAGDIIRGQRGRDTINGGTGDDVIDGGSSGDTINGEGGQDEIEGGSGHDTIRGGTHGDTIDGQKGRDRLIGGSGPDVIDGGSGADDLSGNSGRDHLVGGSAADELDGGKGTDVCEGGTGADIAVRCETRSSASAG